MALRALKERKAGKEYRCGRCGDTIPKGTQYRYWEMGFRPSYKRIVCMKATCTPRASERETSNVSEAYAAQEGAEDALDSLASAEVETWEDVKGDIERAVTEAGEAIYDVGYQYREADEAFGGQGATESAERADTLEAAADELQGFTIDDAPEPCSEHDTLTAGCSDCEENVGTWFDSAVTEARDAVTGVELP